MLISDHSRAVPPDVAAQSLACHLYNDLPDRILREISKSHHGSNSFNFREGEPGELVSHIVRRSLSSAYKDWLHRQDWPISNVSTPSTDTHVHDRRWKSHYSQLGIEESPSESNKEADKHDEKQSSLALWDPARPMSTISTIDRIEFVLLQTRLCADWHLRQYQQIPSPDKCSGNTPVNLVDRLPEIRDDQGLWYKFYLAVVMLKRKEPSVGWNLVEEGCKITRGILEQPSRSFFPNLYNHFGSHKWDEFESLRLQILQYLKGMSAVLLGTNHPLTIILRHLAIEGFLKNVSEPALKIMLDVYAHTLYSMHPDVIQAERSLCMVFRRQNEFSTATDRVTTMLRHSEQVNGRYDTNTRRCMRRLGHLYRYQERYADAEKMYRDVIQLAEDSSVNRGDLDDLALCTVHDLVSITFQAHQFEAAESWARLAMAAVADGRNITPENYLVCVLDLHKCLEAQGRVAEARDWEEQCSAFSCIPPQESCEEHALLSSISKDHFAWVLAESGHPYLLPDAY
jgi:tetratricopeptide (TPR) repeat protein